MLHKDPFIITPETFKLNQQLQSIPELKEFYLAGKTALALQLGHQNSIDIDLFTRNNFEPDNIVNVLSGKFTFSSTLARKGTLLAVVNIIKTNFIRPDFEILKPPITQEGITFLSKENITAMKFHAIIQSGKRLKDFIDVYFLLEHYSLQQMIDFFAATYKFMNPMIAVKAVNFFGDIDEKIDPLKMPKPLPLKKIVNRIQEATLKPGKTFKQD